MRRDRAVKVVLEDVDAAGNPAQEVIAILLPTGADCVEFVQDSAPVLSKIGDLPPHGPTRMSEVLALLVKWLPRLCPDFETATDEEVTRAVLSGGATSAAIVKGFLRVMGAASALGNVKDEVLVDYPFA